MPPAVCGYDLRVGPRAGHVQLRCHQSPNLPQLRAGRHRVVVLRQNPDADRHQRVVLDRIAGEPESILVIDD